MPKQECDCGHHPDQECASCESADRFWCETCGIAVPTKRCPHCGLKARGRRETDGR